MRSIIGLIHSQRIDLSSEKAAQADIEKALTAAGVVHRREVRLSTADVPDFLLADGAVIEVKVKGARKTDIFRQLQRYADHDAVSALLLVTNITMGLPPEINSKPVFFASLGRGWL